MSEQQPDTPWTPYSHGSPDNERRFYRGFLLLVTPDSHNKGAWLWFADDVRKRVAAAEKGEIARAAHGFNFETMDKAKRGVEQWVDWHLQNGAPYA